MFMLLRRKRFHLVWRRALATATLVPCLLALCSIVWASPGQPAADIDQIRNGAFDSPNDPGEWVNGNAGHQNAHYLEGHSIGYRARLTDLPVGETITLILGYDIKHGRAPRSGLERQIQHHLQKASGSTSRRT